MLAEIGVKFGADVKELVTGSNQVNTSLKQISAQSEKTASDLQSVNQNLITSGGKARSVISEIGQAAVGSNSFVGELLGTIGGFGIAGVAVGLIVHQITKLREEHEAAAEAAKKQREEEDKIISSITSEGVKVGELVQRIESGNLSRAQTKSAIKELIKLAPENFSGLDKEKDVVSKIAIAYSAYKDSLLGALQVKIIETQVNKLLDERTRIASSIDLTKVSNETLQEQIKLRELLIKRGLSQEEINKRVAAIAPQQVFFGDLKGQQVKIQALDQEIDTLISKINEIHPIKVIPDNSGETLAQKLEKEISALEKFKKELGGAFTTADEFKLTNLKIELAQIDTRLSPDEKSRLIQQLKKDFFAFGTITVPSQLNVEGTFTDDLKKQLEKGFDIAKDFKKGLNGGDVVIKSQLIEAGAQAQAFQERMQAIADIVNSSLKPAFDDFFKTLLSGGKNAFQVFAQAIAQVIQKLIAAAIEAAIFAGITALITGKPFSLSGFKNTFSGLSGLPKFAEGGFTGTGPSGGFLAVLHPNELVVPLNKASRATQGSSSLNDVALQPSIRYDGDGFFIMMERVKKKRGRIN